MDECREKRRIRMRDVTVGRRKTERELGSISISDYFTSTESSPAWTMLYPLFCVLPTYLPYRADFVFFALRPCSTSALFREENTPLQNTMALLIFVDERERKRRECTHLKRINVSRVSGNRRR